MENSFMNPIFMLAFKSQFFQNYEWDISSEPIRREKSIKRLQQSEKVFLFLQKLGIKFEIPTIIWKFAYFFCWEKKRCSYIFILKNNEVINVNQIKKRNNIGIAIDRYYDMKVILWHPQQNESLYEKFYYYLPKGKFQSHIKLSPSQNKQTEFINK